MFNFSGGELHNYQNFYIYLKGNTRATKGRKGITQRLQHMPRGTADGQRAKRTNYRKKKTQQKGYQLHNTKRS